MIINYKGIDIQVEASIAPMNADGSPDLSQEKKHIKYTPLTYRISAFNQIDEYEGQAIIVKPISTVEHYVKRYAKIEAIAKVLSGKGEEIAGTSVIIPIEVEDLPPEKAEAKGVTPYEYTTLSNLPSIGSVGNDKISRIMNGVFKKIFGVFCMNPETLEYWKPIQVDIATTEETYTIDSQTGEAVYNQDGTATFTITTGEVPYEYSLDSGTTWNIIEGNEFSLSSLGSGNKTLRLKSATDQYETLIEYTIEKQEVA